MEWIIENANKPIPTDNAPENTLVTNIVSPQNVLKLQTANAEIIQASSEAIDDQNAKEVESKIESEKETVNEGQVNSLKCDE
jgi:hypothetical protein